MPDLPETSLFVPVTVHKRDEFSETISGHMPDDPSRQVVYRRLDRVKWYFQPLAQFLARKEVRGLQAVQGIEGTPELIHSDWAGILRGWSSGTPLHLARPDDAAFYKDAKRLLRAMRRVGVTHNDIAKPQNWLMTPDGRAAVIDFQLASVHRRRGWFYYTMAREDLRHLLKQKRNFAPHLLTASEKRMLARKSLPTRVWMATGKRVYNFVTRKLMNWSDGEGTGDRIKVEGPSIQAALMGVDRVQDMFLTSYPLPARGVGIYVFVETDLTADDLRPHLRDLDVNLLQPVSALPRWPNGDLRQDILQLIAMNRLDELDVALSDDEDLIATIAPIKAGRLNLTDRKF